MKGAEYATGYCPNSTVWMQIRQLSTGPDVQLREDCNIKRATIANLTGPCISFRCNWKHYESDVKCMISWLCGSLGEWLRWQQVTHDLPYRISYFLYLARTLFVLYCIYGRYNKVFLSKYLGLLDITCMCFVILHYEAEPKLIVYQWWPSSFTSYDVWSPKIINTLRPRQDGRHFPDYILKCIFLNTNVWISLTISLKCVRKVRISNIPSLVQIMAWRRPGDKPLSEPLMVSLLTHVCVTRPQWVKWTLK